MQASWFAKLLALSVGLAVAGLGNHSVYADAIWTGASSQDWNTVANWSTTPSSPSGVFSNNIATGNFAIITANSSFTPTSDWIGNGTGTSGRVDHRSGSLIQNNDSPNVNGDSKWYFVVGKSGGTGTYNLADTSVTGQSGITTFGTGSGSLFVEKLWLGGSYFGDNGTGTLNVNTTGSIIATNVLNPFNDNNAVATIILGSQNVANGGFGTINLENGTVQGFGRVYIGRNGVGTVNQTGGAFVSSNLFVLAWNSGSAGTYNFSGGSVSALGVNGEIQVGVSGAGTNNMTGGAMTSASSYVIGLNSGSVGVVNISGGTVFVATNTTQAKPLILAVNGGSQGFLNISNNGAVIVTAGQQCLVGSGGTGSVTITNNGSLTATHATEGVRLGAFGGNGTLNLNGGTNVTTAVSKGTGLGTNNFNGGILKAAASNTNFMTGLTAANVCNGGAVIDTAGFNVTIAQVLQHSVISGDNATDGGLTKQGAGTLTLSGANTYNGVTTVRNGTLSLSNGVTLTSASGAVNVTAADGNATLSCTGNSTINGLVTLSASGSFNAGINLSNSAATDTLTLAGGLTLNTGNALTFEVGTTADKIAITGGSYTVPASPSLINIVNLPSLAAGTNKLITGASGISLSSFTLNSTPPPGFTYALQVTGNDLELVVAVTVPTTAFWKGGVSGVWNAADSGGFFNWATDSGGATSTGGKPGVPTDVTFSASGAANESTTLGENFEVKSVTFTSSGNVTIGGGNTLQVNNGITVNSGAGTNTISAGGLVLGSSQTVANNSANALTISSIVSGSSSALTVGGTGQTILSANNTYGGGTVVSSGTLKLGASGVLPDGASKGNVTVDGTLDLNAFSETINGLSGSGSVDTLAGGTPTLTVGGDNQTGSFSGNLLNTTGTLSVVKTGTGSQTLSGAASTYSGGTTVNGGTLLAGSANALGTGTVNLNGGMLGASAAVTIPNNIAVTGANGIGQSTAQAITLSGALTGSGALTNFIGTSADANVFFTGNLSGFSGTLDYTCQQNNTTEWWRVGSGDNTPTTVDLSGASVILRIGNVTSPNAFNKNFGFRDNTSTNILKLGALSGDGVFQDAWAGGANVLEAGFLNTDTTFSGILGGGNVASAMSFTKLGAGTLTLSGANRFTGAVVVNGGTLYTTMANAANNRVFSLVSGITVNTNTTLIASANSLFGWDGTQAKPITVNAGGTAISTNGDVNVGIITLAGGTLASGNPDPFWGSWNFGRATSKKLLVTENSTVTAEVVGFHNGATIEVDSGKTLNFLGTIGAASDGGSAVTKTGNGTLTLAGTNTYTGNTTISAGTLALSGNGSIASTTNIVLANGAKFDVSGLSTTFVLGSGQTLTNISGTGLLAGNVNLASGALALNFTNGTPSLSVTNGTLAFNSNAVTVNVAGSLAHGVYKLISTNTGGLVTGTLPTTITVNGDIGTSTGSLSLSNNELYLTVNHSPMAGDAIYTRNAGIHSLRIAISDLLTNVTDVDSDAITLVGTGTSTNGIVLTTDGTNYLYYYNTNNVADQFSYTVTDGFGGTNSGLVSIAVSNAVTGQVTGQFTSFTGGVANLTFYGIPNYSYITERTTNLTDWVDIATNAAATNGVINVSDTFSDLGGVPPPSAYYRLKWQP